MPDISRFEEIRKLYSSKNVIFKKKRVKVIDVSYNFSGIYVCLLDISNPYMQGLKNTWVPLDQCKLISKSRIQLIMED